MIRKKRLPVVRDLIYQLSLQRINYSEFNRIVQPPSVSADCLAFIFLQQLVNDGEKRWKDEIVENHRFHNSLSNKLRFLSPLTALEWWWNQKRTLFHRTGKKVSHHCVPKCFIKQMENLLSIFLHSPVSAATSKFMIENKKIARWWKSDCGAECLQCLIGVAVRWRRQQLRLCEQIET